MARASRDLSEDAAGRTAGEPIPTWLRRLVVVMDDAIPIPGMNRGVGLDAILGAVFPGVGDAVTGLTTFALLYVAVKRGVPGSVLFRMIGNQLVDFAFGSIPGVGDVFDVFYRSNRRNLELIEAHVQSPIEPTLADRIYVAFALAVAVGVGLLPFVVAFFVIRALVHAFGG